MWDKFMSIYQDVSSEYDMENGRAREICASQVCKRIIREMSDDEILELLDQLYNKCYFKEYDILRDMV